MSSSSDYSSVVRKGLKLKGSSANSSATARKKRELPPSDAVVPPPPQTPASDAPAAKRGKTGEPSSPPAELSAAAVALEAYERKLTPAERAFQLAQRKRERERAAKKVALTHRQKMERLNSHLATLSEHFDIPKVGPG